MPSIKGTASVSDARAMSKALKSAKFPKNFSKKVDLSKINRNIMMDWIEEQVTKILGFEDEIVASTAGNLFMPESEEGSSMAAEVNPKHAQINLAGFLGDDQAAEFSKELWRLLLDAQDSPGGVPKEIMEAKKKELEEKRRAEQARMPQRPYQRDNNRDNNYRRGGDRGGYGPREGGRSNDRWRNEPPPRRNYRHDDYNNGPPRHYNNRGPPPPRDNYRGPPRDYPRYPRPVSPPHPGYDDRDRGLPPPPPYRGGSIEDEFGRARMPPRRGSPERNDDRDRRPSGNYGRRNSRDRNSGGTEIFKESPPPVNNEVARQNSNPSGNDDARADGEGRPTQFRSRSPSARSSSSEDSYDRRRRRRRKEKDRKRERRSRKKDRSYRSDEEESDDDRYHRKRRGGRDSRSRSRSRDSPRRKRSRSNSSDSSQYSDRRR